MEPIESLLDKYWKGETTLEEEKLVKKHFAKQKTSENVDGSYFNGISKRKEMKYRGETPGFHISFNKRWVSLAATVIIGVMVGIISLQQDSSKDPYLVEDPEKALEITRNAFQMISNNLNEGKKYSREINNINKSRQVLEINSN